jgi:hypothetical protein
MALPQKTVFAGLFVLFVLVVVLLSSFYVKCLTPVLPLSEDQEKCFQLSAELSEAHRLIKEKTEECDGLEKENTRISKTMDRLASQLSSYPRDTPEDIIKENKSLRRQLLKNDGISLLGYLGLVDMLEGNRNLRAENWGLKKANQAYRIYLENQGVYLSDITGKKIDTTESPLYIEKAEHRVTVNKLRLERANREADRYSYEARLSKSGQNVAEAMLQREVLAKERDKYKGLYEEWMKYAKSLEVPQIVPIR